MMDKQNSDVRRTPRNRKVGARTTNRELYPQNHLLKAVVERMIFTYINLAFTNR